MPLCHALCNGANHNFLAASVRKLSVVLVAPTQHEQNIVVRNQFFFLSLH